MKQLTNKEARQLFGGGDGLLDNVVTVLYYFVPALHLLDLSTDNDSQHTDDDDK